MKESYSITEVRAIFQEDLDKVRPVIHDAVCELQKLLKDDKDFYYSLIKMIVELKMRSEVINVAVVKHFESVTKVEDKNFTEWDRVSSIKNTVWKICHIISKQDSIHEKLEQILKKEGENIYDEMSEKLFEIVEYDFLREEIYSLPMVEVTGQIENFSLNNE